MHPSPLSLLCPKLTLLGEVPLRLDRSKLAREVDLEVLEAILSVVAAVLVAAVVLVVAAFPVVEQFVRNSRLRPAEGTERETAPAAQSLSTLVVPPKSHHLNR